MAYQVMNGVLNLSNKNLKEIPKEVFDLVEITKLNLSHNQLTSLPSEIRKLVNLEELWVSRNQLTSLPSEIGKLVNLGILWVHNNQLTSLPSEIGQLVNLEKLVVFQNQLTFLPSEIGKLVNLKDLSVSYNQLTSLPSEIGLLRNLAFFGYSNNPVEYIPPQVQRLINRLQNNGQEVYLDEQSVHNSGIQTSFKETVSRLSNKKPKLNIHQTIEEVLESSLLDDSKKSIVEYCSSIDVHSELNMTYSELLVLVWDRIRKNKDVKEILKVLDTELTDSECKCFTGRITRLVNCLNGFDTDVIINISDNEQLSNLMVLINSKYDNIEDKKTELIKAMKERGFSQEKIDEWVEYID